MLGLCLIMRVYELVLILKSSLSDAQKKKTLDTVKDWIKELKIVKEEQIGQKLLSYKIKKEDNGYFVRLLMEAKEIIPQDLEKRLLGEENILRHLLLRNK